MAEQGTKTLGQFLADTFDAFTTGVQNLPQANPAVRGASRILGPMAAYVSLAAAATSNDPYRTVARAAAGIIGGVAGSFWLGSAIALGTAFGGPIGGAVAAALLLGGSSAAAAALYDALYAGLEIARELVSPLVIDLDGDGTEFNDLAQTTAYFDLDADGFAEKTAWVSGDDGLLALDRNGDGVINDISELFGTNNAPDGFAASAELDTNLDGVIDGQDARFADLRVWRDVNSDGFTDEGELRSLGEASVASISLQATPTGSQQGDVYISHTSTITRTDGSTGEIVDAWFKNDPVWSYYTDTASIEWNPEAFFLPQLTGHGRVPSLIIAMSLDAQLFNLVNQFNQMPIANASQFSAAAEQILLRWAGVDTLDPGSRGPNVDARHLEFLEKFLAYSYVQFGSPDPLGRAGAAIEESWTTLRRELETRLLFQGPLLAYFPDVYYHSFHDQLVGTGLGDGVAAIADDIGADPQVALSVWRALVPVLNTANTQLGNLAGYEVALRQGVASSTGLPVPVEAKRLDGVAFGTAASEDVDGTAGNDALYGGPGNDDLIGGAGDDAYIVKRGEGDDRVSDASGAADVLTLGADIAPGDVDVVRGGYWTQSLFLNFAGTSDSLEILGYFSSSGLIEAIRFADGTAWTYDQVNTMVQTGSPGDDSLVGDAGDNILDGGAGNDGLNGQGGNDTYVFGPGYGFDTIAEGGGVDALLFNPGIDPDDIIARHTGTNGRDLTLYVAGTSDQVRIVWQFFNAGNVVEEVRFADGTLWDYDDIRVQVVKPTESNDVLKGDAGDDYIEGRGGNDTLSGEGGNDTYGFDRGWGADTIGDGGGYDVAILGPGIAPADIVARRTNGFDDLTLYVIGTADSLRFSGYFASATWRVEEIRFADGTVWDYDDVRAEVLKPSAGNDLLAGDGANDLLDGQGGNDELWGQGGDDTYIYARGYGIDRVVEAGGYDVLSFAAGIAPADIVARRTDQATNATFYLAGTSEQVYVENYFSSSNAVVEAIRFADGTVWDFDAVRLQVLKPTQGNDFLVGDDANDLLDGQGGNDDLRGKGGDDTYIFAPGYGVDRITDEGGAADALVFANGILPINVIASRTGHQNRDLTLQVAGTSDSITISFWFSNPTAYTVEEVRFENGTVWDRAATMAQLLLGTGANETINGYSSNDLIEGRGGNDNLYGLEGDDTLVGGAGADLVDGGLGNDVYRIGRGDGADRVDDNETDWAASQDRAEFGDAIAYDQLWLTRAGDDLLFSVVGTSDSLKVLNWYGTDAAKLDLFRTSDGFELTQARVEQLVQAMAQFAPPSGADPYIPLDVRQQLDQPLAAAWQPVV